MSARKKSLLGWSMWTATMIGLVLATGLGFIHARAYATPAIVILAPAPASAPALDVNDPAQLQQQIADAIEQRQWPQLVMLAVLTILWALRHLCSKRFAWPWLRSWWFGVLAAGGTAAATAGLNALAGSGVLTKGVIQACIMAGIGAAMALWPTSAQKQPPPPPPAA